MRKALRLAFPAIVLLAFFAQGCSSSNSNSEPSSSKTPEEIIEAYTKGWATVNPASVSPLFGKDGLYKDPAYPLGIRDKELEDYILYVASRYPYHLFEHGDIVKIDETHYKFEWWFKKQADGTISLKGSDTVEIVDGYIKNLQGEF